MTTGEGSSPRSSDVFRKIADSLPQIIWALAPDGRIAWVNRRFIEVTGRDPSAESAIDDGHITAFVHPDDLRLADEWRAAFARGEAYAYEFRMKLAGGTYRWFFANATPYRDETGAIEWWYGVSTDIDDIKRADASLRAILESIPELVWVSEADGLVTRVNAPLCAYAGMEASELLGNGWLALVHPDDRSMVLEARKRGFSEGTVTEFTCRLKRHDGVFRYHLNRSAPMRDATSDVVLWAATATDIDDQLREREELRLLADTIPQFICVSRPDGTLEYANEQFWAYTGVRRDVEAFVWVDVLHPDDIERARAFWKRRDDAPEAQPELELRIRRSDGTYRWFQSRISAHIDDHGTRDRFYTTATDIHERKRAADMMAFLAEVSEVLSSTRAVDAALELASRLAVPRIADWCAVYLREPNGFFRPATIHHGDPAKVQLANELVRRYPFSVESERRLIKTRSPLFMPFISAEMIAAGAIDARHESILQQLDIASAIVVPLIVDDEVTGMVHLVRGRTSEAFVGTDVDFTQILANRIAVAIDNAIVYERERNVATTFQNAALPRSLPRIEGVSINHAYRAGDSAAAVGGDWYDAVQLRDGSLLFSIGDVAGKGLEAAVLMASMRQAIRVAALQGLTPGAVLEAANAALAAEQSGRFVTAFVGRLNVDTGELAYASAGHPMPLIREGDVERTLRPADPPLGVWDGTFETNTIFVKPPWLLIAHTDGLIERTGDIIEGEALLRLVVADDGIMHVADPAAYLQARLLSEPVRDDTAILSIRVDGPGRWRFGAEDALQAETARQRLTAWLGRWTRVETCAAEIICGELIGNVVRHAPGAIDIDVACAGQRVRIFVQSSGKPIALQARLPDSIMSENGRGLFLIEALGSDLRATALPVFGNQVSVDLPLES